MKTGHVSRQRGDPWWIDMTPVQWAYGWSIYLGGHLQQSNTENSVQLLTHIMFYPLRPCVFESIRLARCSTRIEMGTYLREKEHKADKAYGQFVCESIKKLHLQKIHQYTHVNTHELTCSSSIKAAPTQKKNRIYAHLDLQVCSPCSSLMRLEDAMIWYYMTIYDYIYIYIYATIWYYFVTYLESWIIFPMTLLWIRQCKAKRRISLGTFFTHFRRRLDSCWFCMGNWTYHSAFGYP